MIKKVPLLFLITVHFSFAQNTDIIFTERQGKVTFFSHTPVEDIQASTNQALSRFNPNTKEIVAQILMRTFQFKKSLMYEHFNESYIESGLHPNAYLKALVENFDVSQPSQTRIIKGEFTLRSITKPIEIKARITKENKGYRFEGELEVRIDDHEIKVPGVLSANIAKKIQVSFNFEYQQDEK